MWIFNIITLSAKIAIFTIIKKSKLLKERLPFYILLVYFNEGIFYFHDKDKYVIHEPYLGLRVPEIPFYHRKYVVKGTTYYYYYGAFYTYNSQKDFYEVVAPPNGVIINWVPQEAEKFEIEGDTYYILNGVQYLCLTSPEYYRLYKVIIVDESLYSKGQKINYYSCR